LNDKINALDNKTIIEKQNNQNIMQTTGNEYYNIVAGLLILQLICNALIQLYFERILREKKTTNEKIKEQVDDMKKDIQDLAINQATSEFKEVTYRIAASAKETPNDSTTDTNGKRLNEKPSNGKRLDTSNGIGFKRLDKRNTDKVETFENKTFETFETDNQFIPYGVSNGLENTAYKVGEIKKCDYCGRDFLVTSIVDRFCKNNSMCKNAYHNWKQGNPNYVNTKKKKNARK